MTYKTILLHVDDQANVSGRTQLAVNLALAFDARLIGLYAVDHFPLELRSSSAIVGNELDQLQRETLRRLREKAAAVFHNATSAVDPRANGSASKMIRSTIIHSLPCARTRDAPTLSSSARAIRMIRR